MQSEIGFVDGVEVYLHPRTPESLASVLPMVFGDGDSVAIAIPPYAPDDVVLVSGGEVLGVEPSEVNAVVAHVVFATTLHGVPTETWLICPAGTPHSLPVFLVSRKEV